MDKGYAPVRGLRMYYERIGEGRPLVLLHGGLLTIELTFGGIIAPLCASRLVIATELQGHGRTADADREMRVDALADDVSTLLAHLGIERADVFGFSLGATVALSLAVRHPDAVRRLVVASTVLRPDGWHPGTAPGTTEPDMSRVPSKADFEAMVAAYRQVAPSPGDFSRVAAKTQAMLAGYGGLSDDEVGALRAPTLVVVGDRDFVRLEHAVEMRDRIPDCRLAVLPGTTHMGVMRRSDLLVGLVQPFLDEPD